MKMAATRTSALGQVEVERHQVANELLRVYSSFGESLPSKKRMKCHRVVRKKKAAPFASSFPFLVKRKKRGEV